MSVFINKLQALKSFIESAKPDFKTSSNNDYINKFMNSHNKDYEKYNKNSMSLVDYYNGIIGKIDKKINVINEQIKNKTTYLHYVDNKISSIQFAHKDESTYHITTLQEVLNNGINTSLNYSEDCYLDESNIFYDIDCEDANNDNALTKLQNEFNSFENIYDELTEFTQVVGQSPYVVGIIEYKDNEKLNEFVKTINNNEKFNLIFLKLNDKEKYKNNKDFSGHVFINCYGDRDLINKYILSKAIEFDYLEKSAFDSTVYVGKGDRQCLRCSFSEKIKYNEYIRPVHDKLIDLVNDDEYIDNFKLMSIAPTSESININEFLKQYDYKVKEEICKKQTITKEGTTIKPKTGISILQYIKYNDEFENIKEIAKKGLINSCYELSQKLYMFKSLPLTKDEFEEEFNNLEFDETEGFNKEVIEGLKTKTFEMINYEQSFKNDKTLYIYKNYLYEVKTKIEKENEKDDLNNNVEYKLICKIISKYDFYIEKYAKKCFICHDYFDVIKTFDADLSKNYKIIYNCYKTVENEKAIYYPYKNMAFANITQFRNYFKLNGTKANEIFDKLTCFKNEHKYKIKRIQHNYNLLNNDKMNEINDKVKLFLKYFKQTFINEDEFKFYLSYYSTKINKRTTLNKGLINQGTETAGAHNSLKTFFNDLFNDYLTIVSADVNNINKALNGGYFEGDLCIIEETPKNIKDINNLINVLKMYSSKEYLTIEKKGMNPIIVKNKCDIIINSNHTLANLFNNKLDCEALLKRFKIIQRKSLKSEYFNKGHELNELLDYIKGNDMFKYALYTYVKKYGDDDYYKYKNVYNHIEELYKESANEENTNDKLETKLNLNDWIEEFKRCYINPKTNRLIISRLLTSLQTLKSYKDMKQKTLKTIVIRLLTEENEGSIKINDNNIVMTKAKLEDYNKLYNYFFEYTGEDVEQCEKSDDEIEI